MSDRSYFQLRFYHVPPDEEAAIREVMDDNGLNTDDTIPLVNDDNAWDAEECPLDMYEQVGAAIAAVASGTTFACWSDPKYEYLGGLWMHAPGLGSFTHDCDAAGNATFTAREVGTFVAEARQPDGTIDTAIFERKLGLPWDAAIAAAQAESTPA
jgi:hypothetical protein